MIIGGFGSISEAVKVLLAAQTFSQSPDYTRRTQAYVATEKDVNNLKVIVSPIDRLRTTDSTRARGRYDWRIGVSVIEQIVKDTDTEKATREDELFILADEIFNFLDTTNLIDVGGTDYTMLIPAETETPAVDRRAYRESKTFVAPIVVVVKD